MSQLCCSECRSHLKESLAGGLCQNDTNYQMHNVYKYVQTNAWCADRALMGTLLMGCFRADGEGTQVGLLWPIHAPP